MGALINKELKKCLAPLLFNKGVSPTWQETQLPALSQSPSFAARDCPDSPQLAPGMDLQFPWPFLRNNMSEFQPLRTSKPGENVFIKKKNNSRRKMTKFVPSSIQFSNISRQSKI